MRISNRTITIAVLVVAALVALKIRTATAKKPTPQLWTPSCVSTVPRAWGDFKGGSTQTGLAFEDRTGTLRFLTNIPCDGTPAIALEIHRTSDNTPPR